MPHSPAFASLERLVADRVVSRIWYRDIGVWGAAEGSADARSIATRLGWLDVAHTMAPELERVKQVGERAMADRLEAVYLLGMGGSSLCAEVLRSVVGVADGHPELFVLDSTDAQTIVSAATRLTPERTLFVVASKSGGTVEVASLERFFRAHMARRLGDQAGRQFIAITDPGTGLEQLARSSGYADVFLNPPDIGGRFSALSLFGLVPAALIGIDPATLMAACDAMAQECRTDDLANPGLELGAYIGAATLAGRDKLTVLLPASMASLGLWIEQLVAESTGKHGKGALPVVDEPLGLPDEYGNDRAFVALDTPGDRLPSDRIDALERAGHPVLRLTTSRDSLGSEFFRWEFATAVAGAVLGINPFDEPNVSEAKEKTKALLATFANSGRLPETAPSAESSSVSLHGSRFIGTPPARQVAAALDSLNPGDYVAFLLYLPSLPDVAASVDAIRTALRQRYQVASTFGIGPRYLHSTGQYHKGGPNTILAFIITADDETSTEIPDAGYSFSVLKRAQALGDAETLDAHDRRVVRVHVKVGAARASDALRDVFSEALEVEL